MLLHVCRQCQKSTTLCWKDANLGRPDVTGQDEEGVEETEATTECYFGTPYRNSLAETESKAVRVPILPSRRF